MRRLTVLMLVTCCLMVFSGASIVQGQEQSAQQGEVIHVVQPGENLFRISLRYGVPIGTIAQANNIANPSLIYSGQRLDVDPDSGLIGECDFIITATPPLPLIQAPIVCIIEAKKNDIETGLGQCVAQMLGALRLNQRDATGIETIFGCVTTGEIWQFLKLEQNDIIIDQERYYIDNIRTILGVLQTIFAQYAPQPATT